MNADTSQPTTLASVTIMNGKQLGTCFSLSEGDKKIVGRDNSCQVQILDKGISRNHSLIEWKGDHFLLVDLGSTNGTFVNNKLVISRKLQDGDIVKIGQTELKFKENRPGLNSSASFVMEDVVEHSPNTIMERVNVDQSLSSKQLVNPNKPDDTEGELAKIYLSTIYEVSNLTNAEQDPQKLLEAIVDKIMQIFKPDRCFIVLPEGEEFQIAIARDKEGGEAKLSSTVLKRTIREGISFLSANAMIDERFSGSTSIVAQNIQSVMSVPLESSKEILGAIYIDDIGSSNRFKKVHLDLLTAIGKQAGVAIHRANLFHEHLDKERMQQALKIAQSIQESLLPSVVPDNFEYDWMGWNKPCDEAGGDYYDLIELPNAQWAIAIGDVTGHGIGAALLMATARAFIKALAGKSHTISEMMNELNRLMACDMGGERFITLFYCELDTQKMTLRYANAGHQYPILYRHEQKTFEALGSTGIPLGMIQDSEYEEGEEVKVYSGDILVLSTDGITEAMNPQGEQFGEERLNEVVLKNHDKSANQIIKNFSDELQKFSQSTNWRDDVTLVVVKFDHRFQQGKTVRTYEYTTKRRPEDTKQIQ